MAIWEKLQGKYSCNVIIMATRRKVRFQTNIVVYRLFKCTQLQRRTLLTREDTTHKIMFHSI